MSNRVSNDCLRRRRFLLKRSGPSFLENEKTLERGPSMILIGPVLCIVSNNPCQGTSPFITPITLFIRIP